MNPREEIAKMRQASECKPYVIIETAGVWDGATTPIGHLDPNLYSGTTTTTTGTGTVTTSSKYKPLPSQPEASDPDRLDTAETWRDRPSLL